ncbi:hypothetical protein BST23_10880 [Mycolicibacterium elephantis]|uniref:Transmembrane protein n=2 Tax=Mycolicibacterium elephantis TaxID=81858 RepID=A0A0M2ZEM6_9MYCO|nr:membrane protein [Mycolicibacterium elephantis]OBB18423.1 hypothetical protein A5762_21095 [Mycolicibacterium elephantis]OBE93531.1 hypothetical protein A5776_02850 [Mycolicibacterium elephantis]ORA66206.1 hypothetical protein BST23_10880 [Mycolicibacterium elephantis]
MRDTVGPEILAGEPTEPYTPLFTGEMPVSPPADQPPSEPLPAPAHPLVVPGSYQFLKRWMFVGVVACMWIVAGAAGWGMYYWWFHSIDKTLPVFVVLVFVMVCTVAGLLMAMVQDRPVISALAIAVMSAPLAATGGAAVLHGLKFCEYASRCFGGLIPY